MKRVLAVTAAVAIVALASASLARPGGGGSFSGSRSGSSSSSSGSRSGSSSSSSGSSRSSTSSTSSSSGSAVRTTSSSTSSSSGSTPEPAPVYLRRVGRGPDRTDLNTISPNKTKTPRPEPWPPPNEINMAIGGAVILGGLIMALAVIGAVIYLLARSKKRHAGKGWSTQQAVRVQGRAELDAIRGTDPDFSIALFEDFLYALYTEVHAARGARTLERLSPYLRPNVRQGLTQRTTGPVSDVVVGAMRFLRFHDRDQGRWGVVVEFESNYTEGARAYWATERWTLWRARTAKSRPPERARVLACPNCGAPLDKVIGGTCRHCNTTVDQGRFDWIVDSIGVVAIEPRGPMLTGTVEEQGTDLPTLVDPQLQPRLAALTRRDRAFSMPALHARVGLVFSTMQVAWSSLEWQRARPFLSDNLWETQRYWIEAYRRSGLRNVTERTRILKVDTARLTEDRWFDAITLRVYATGLDYTLRVADNQVVGGDRSKERTYSEYWTFLRGTSATGAAKSDPGCPSCGAPLAVTMAGDCTHCKVKVNSGAFDWVLARIEQDEAYTG